MTAYDRQVINCAEKGRKMRAIYGEFSFGGILTEENSADIIKYEQMLIYENEIYCRE